MTKRAEKRALFMNIEFTETRKYCYRLNDILILTLGQVEGELYELISPAGSRMEIQSFEKAKFVADDFTDRVKAFCERLKISKVTHDILHERFAYLHNDMRTDRYTHLQRSAQETVVSL
jgi:hypothetical protein